MFPEHANPGMQQPLFELFGQAEYPRDVLQSGTESPHVFPAAQQPTGPLPVSVTVTHVSPAGQQLSE